MFVSAESSRLCAVLVNFGFTNLIFLTPHSVRYCGITYFVNISAKKNLSAKKFMKKNEKSHDTAATRNVEI